jgi:hypothetical protein
MKHTQKTPAPRLVQCATGWSMMGYPSAKKEWSLERKMKEIKASGFDGIATYATK